MVQIKLTLTLVQLLKAHFPQEIQVNSNIGPPTGENDSEKSQEDLNHDSRNSGKDDEGVSDTYVHLDPEMVIRIIHTILI